MHITPSYYFLIIASVWPAFLADTVPGCPLDSPEMLLADVDNRCDRYWHCHNGVVTSFYCPFGSGFDPFTDTCHNFAACLKNPTTASDPATIDSVRPSISVETLADTIGISSNKKFKNSHPHGDNAGAQHDLNFLSAASRILTPIITPLLSQIRQG